MNAPVSFEEGGSQYSAPFDFEGKAKFRDCEPMLLLDITGSMNDVTAYKGELKRKDMAYMIMKGVSDQLTKMDSAGKHEEDGGGIRTIGFATNNVIDLDDINPGNIDEQWAKIQWGSTTNIVPGWKALQKVFYEEFGNLPRNDQPLQLITVITDGEAEDLEKFTAILEKEVDAYVTIVILGYYNPYYLADKDPHGKVEKSFLDLAAKNSRVRVLLFTNQIDPNPIISSILERATQTS